MHFFENDSFDDDDLYEDEDEEHQEIFLGVKFRNITYPLKTFEICIKFCKIS